jgi:hypothetical protein
MAVVKVTGLVTFRRDYPAKDNRPPQVNVSVVDFGGDRYGMFVPVGSPIAMVEKGTLVQIGGDLRRSEQYLNLDDARLEAVGEITWKKKVAA